MPGVTPKVQIIVYTRHPALSILLLRRPPERGSIWQPVTGKVEPEDRDLPAAARRELFEETGIRAPVCDMEHGFRFTRNDREFREDLFAAEVGSACPVALSGEHDRAAWLEPHEALGRLSWDTHRSCLEWLLDRVAPRGGRPAP
jgi:8-oxo-dGTP pyrophosphatase MutT (NUDIX family)